MKYRPPVLSSPLNTTRLTCPLYVCLCVRLLGYGLGSRNYMTILPFLGTNARACFLLAATVLAISGSITMAVPETPRYRTASADDQVPLTFALILLIQRRTH